MPPSNATEEMQHLQLSSPGTQPSMLVCAHAAVRQLVSAAYSLAAAALVEAPAEGVDMEYGLDSPQGSGR